MGGPLPGLVYSQLVGDSHSMQDLPSMCEDNLTGRAIMALSTMTHNSDIRGEFVKLVLHECANLSLT